MLLDIYFTFYSYESVPKMKAALSIETLINIYQTIRRHIPDDSCLRCHLRENHVCHASLYDQHYEFGLDVNLRCRNNAVTVIDMECEVLRGDRSLTSTQIL
jgi:hypothetical protein